MPSSITHAYFSIDTYNKLPTKYQAKTNIDYLKIFSQGSDPFMFYNFFIGKSAKEMTNLQETIHTKKTASFFKNTIKYIHKHNLYNNKEIMSYLYGYICHYYLDLYTHPYIYYKSGIFNKFDKSTYKYNAIHQKYEYLIDLYLINKKERIPYYKFKPHQFLFKNTNISRTLANLIDTTLENTYKYKNISKYYQKSLKHMYLFYKYINYDPYSYKLFIYTIIDKITPKKIINLKELSFHNKLDNIDKILNSSNQKWNLPWDKEKTSPLSFKELYNLALNNTIDTIIKITDMLDEKKLDNKLLDTLFKNLSLTTGINCNNNIIMKYFEF